MAAAASGAAAAYSGGGGGAGSLARTDTLSATPEFSTLGGPGITFLFVTGIAPSFARCQQRGLLCRPEWLRAALVATSGIPPVSSITESTPNGQTGLPSGVTFTDNGANATLSCTGTCDVTAGVYTFTLTAANGVPPNATRGLHLEHRCRPHHQRLSTVSLRMNTEQSYTITTTGYPYPALTYTGTLPPGMALTDNGHGTATLSGSPGQTPRARGPSP